MNSCNPYKATQMRTTRQRKLTPFGKVLLSGMVSFVIGAAIGALNP